MRVFISVNLPAEAKKELERLQKELQKKHWPVKWEKPKKIHVTLAFLGNLKGKILKVKSAIEKGVLEISPFEVSFKGIGAFPGFVKPRIVWVGLKGNLQGLAKLQKNIELELKKEKIWFDKKPFVPHMTIGRVKKGIGKGALQDLGKKIKKRRQIDFQSKIEVKSVDIMKSTLLPKGSVYKKLAEVRL